MKYEISDNIKNNIFVLLNRIKYNGLKEVQIVNEIMNCLNNPIEEMGDENNKIV